MSPAQPARLCGMVNAEAQHWELTRVEAVVAVSADANVNATSQHQRCYKPQRPPHGGVSSVQELTYLVPGDARRSSGKSVSGWTFISPRTPCGCRITPTTTSSGAVAGGCAAAAAVLVLGLRSGP